MTPARTARPASTTRPASTAGPASTTRPAGAHVPVAGGLATGGLRYARQIGAEAIQVFVSNPRGWALSVGDRRQDTAFRDEVTAAALPVFVHAPYLVNVASPDQATWQRSVAALRHSLARGAAIGARGVVVHPGSAAGGDRGAALRRAREALLPVLDALGEHGPRLLLEPTAGQGFLLCGTLSDLVPYLDALDWHPRAGVCLDTCHLFAAGHDLAAPGAAAALLAEFAAVLAAGPAAGTADGRLGLIHANDSKDGCGSRRDRHQNIGAGQIGTGVFAGLLAHPATAGVPFIAETPGPVAAHAADVATLKRLRDQPASSAAAPASPAAAPPAGAQLQAPGAEPG